MRLGPMLIVLLLLSSSGCLDGRKDGSRGKLSPTLGNGAGQGEETTGFRWALMNSTISIVALRVRVLFDQAVECTVTEGVRILSHGPGLVFLSVIEDGAGRVRTNVAEYSPFFHVHATGVVDTRTQDSPGGGLLLESKRHLGVAAGGVILTWAAQAIAGEGPSRWNYVEGPTGSTAYLEFRCDATFRLTEYMVGSTVTLLSQKSMTGGVGGHAEGIVSISTEDESARSEPGPMVQLMSGALSVQGSAKVQHPGGQADWSFSLGNTTFHKLEGAEGGYSIRLSALGVGQDYMLWIAVLSLHPKTWKDDASWQ